MGRSFKVQLAWILVVAAMLPLAACGADTGDSDAGAEQPTTGTKAPATGGDEAGTLEGVAALTEMTESGVSGEATLRWNPDTGVLDVTVELMGVAEGAMYAGMIAPGCGPGSGHHPHPGQHRRRT